MDSEGALVVVPTLNEQAHIGALLTQLRADPAARRIVVADGGSRDATPAIVAEHAASDPRVVLMDNPDRIQSAGVNRAVARFGEGERWLVRVDAHCLYPDGYVGALVQTAERTGAVSVVVPMQTRGVSCFQIACAAAQNSVLGTGGSAHRHVGEGQYVEHGHHALMSIAAFRQAGGYNQAMSHNEDAELDHRLGRFGRIWLEPAHAITYFPRRDPYGLWRQYRGYGKGRAQTIAMHRMRPRLRQMVPLAVPLAVVLALGSPWCVLLALPLLAWAMLCLGAGLAVGARQGSRCAMLAGVAAMIMHLGWGSGFLQQWLFGKTPR
ncbi:glycosyltransferase family 2 protein [Sphingomonas sp. MMS12-HWE2-04]|uniref:glycosyltransferase family 2 protein n=1 Tax=Sphingomonas sp. MMS12-HWE2-04 TaxID=3234199 RepID=UPI00384D423E